jgi:U3 small nucleolar RNA-associated protein 10
MASSLKQVHHQVSSRLGSDALVSAIAACRVPALGHGPVSVRALLEMTSTFAKRLKRAEIALHHRDLASFLIAILDTRHRLVFRAVLATIEEGGSAVDMLSSWRDPGTWERTETLCVSCFMSIVVKMTEIELKPVFVRLLSWASISESAGNSIAPVSARSEADSEVTLHRRITFFALLRALTNRLKTIVVPYYERVLPEAITVLVDVARGKKTKSHVGWEGGNESGEKSRGAKRRRLQDSVLVVQDESRADSLLPPDVLLLQRVLQALQSCFHYDSIGFLTKERFERVQAPLAAVVSGNLVARLQGRETFLAFMNSHYYPCVCDLAIAAGNDLLWKPLNHSLFMRARDASPAVRLVALRSVVSIFERVGAEYVVLLPEMIPFMAELLEDTDEAVEHLALELKHLAERLSGELLDPYLNT